MDITIKLPPRSKALLDKSIGMVKNNWKDVIATAVLRIAKCFEATDPGACVIPIGTFVVGLMTSALTIHSEPTWTGVVFGTLWKWTWLTLLAWGIMYAIYELYQGCKWLSKWSQRVKYEKEQKARKS